MLFRLAATILALIFVIPSFSKNMRTQFSVKFVKMFVFFFLWIHFVCFGLDKKCRIWLRFLFFIYRYCLRFCLAPIVLYYYYFSFWYRMHSFRLENAAQLCVYDVVIKMNVLVVIHGNLQISFLPWFAVRTESHYESQLNSLLSFIVRAVCVCVCAMHAVGMCVRARVGVWAKFHKTSRLCLCVCVCVYDKTYYACTMYVRTYNRTSIILCIKLYSNSTKYPRLPSSPPPRYTHSARMHASVRCSTRAY